MTTIYDIGDRPALTCAMNDNAGLPADPTGLTFQLRAPDGTLTTYVYGTDMQLVRDSEGRFYVDWLITQAGSHAYRFVATGSFGQAQESTFDVRESIVLWTDTAELNAADVEAFTGGRLPASDTEVQRMLQAALVVARRDAGWHVNPIRVADVVTLDGPDSKILWLPTRKLVTLASIIEGGTAITPLSTKLTWSAGGNPGFTSPVRVRKKNHRYWSCDYQDIVVTMDHGYTNTEAGDWRQAVLSMIDQMALIPVSQTTGSSEFGVSRKQVDDVAYSYMSPYVALAETVLFSMDNIFCDYRLPTLEFM